MHHTHDQACEGLDFPSEVPNTGTDSIPAETAGEDVRWVNLVLDLEHHPEQVGTVLGLTSPLQPQALELAALGGSVGVDGTPARGLAELGARHVGWFRVELPLGVADAL
jgi:hypothetical protein